MLSEAMNEQNNERQECIDLLLKLGAQDLSEIQHPNKPQKKYLQFNFSKSSFISFNFDYPEYDTVSIHHSTKIKYRGYKNFSEVKQILLELGLVENVN